jgi:hypothetical protein
MHVIEWSIAKLEIHLQVEVSENLPSLFFKMTMIEGIDLTHICSIFYNILLEEVKDVSDKEENQEEDDEGDFTDEFLDDEDVEDDDNDNEE